MNYGKPRGNVNLTELLRSVWPEYPCASEMRNDPHDTRKYKSIYANDDDRHVYLITNPASWPFKIVDGRRVFLRPKPELLGKVSDYVRQVVQEPRTAAASGGKQIEW